MEPAGEDATERRQPDGGAGQDADLGERQPELLGHGTGERGEREPDEEREVEPDRGEDERPPLRHPYQTHATTRSGTDTSIARVPPGLLTNLCDLF